MSLSDLLAAGKASGVLLDPRISFLKTDSSGFSAFATVDEGSAHAPISIQIPNSLIIKPENAISDLAVSLQTADSLILFKYYLACLRLGLISNDVFRPYIELLPDLKEISSPLSMERQSLYVFENTALNSSVIEAKLGLLRKDYDQVSTLNQNVSFEDYLWAHLIVTSRTFPYRIVNPSAQPHEVMLLPIVDLLNHKPHAKVEWSSNHDGAFKLSILEPANQAEFEIGKAELFNNYGPKGNAELLMGYGFVLEENEFDSLQLALTLDEELKRKILREWEVKLPVLSDFTNNICDFGKTDATANKDAETTVFMLNEFRPIPDGLLELFCYINKNSGDQGMTLKNTMNGLNQLKQSLEAKYMNRLDKMPAYDDDLISKRDYTNAKIFRQGQLKIYNLSKAEIKSREKKLLKEYRKHFITLKDIYKKDEEFHDFIEVCGWDKEIDKLDKTEMELIIRLWMMKNINYAEFEADSSSSLPPSSIDTKWFLELFNALEKNEAQEDDFMVDLYNQLIPALKENVPELIRGSHWSLNDWLKVDQLIAENSYEKGKTQEPLLIKPLDLPKN